MRLDNFIFADCKKREKRCRGCLIFEIVKGSILSVGSVDNIEGSNRLMFGILSIVDS